ncbi:MAG: DEAD/DEAH box helicase, partial [Acidobacteriota bacterium]
AGAYRLAVRYGFGDQSVSLADLLRARREKRPYFETPEGWVDLRAPAFAELERLERRRVGADGVDGGDGDGDGGDGSVLLSAGELIRLQAGLDRPLDVTGPEDRSAVLRRLLDQRPPTPWTKPEGFLSELRPYQVVGVDWLRFLAEQRLGGLLCDDMGLGKTHQAMALMASLAAEGGDGPFLVVAPTSVMSHWRDKLRRFAPALDSRTYHGADRTLAGLGPRHVVITSYGVLRRDIDEIDAKPFRVAVFDEIQYLKNRGTVSYEAAARLQTAVKLGLTGTPIENALDELKTLFDLVLPGYLGTDQAFHERFDRALQQVGAGMKENRARLDELRRVISPFVLRRLKESVLDELPEKIEDVRRCTLSDGQVALYRQVLETRARPLVAKLRTESGHPLPYLHIFAVLNLLKQICDHPALVSGEAADVDRLKSGKWDLYREILRECLDGGEKVVVFSQYLGMLEIMAGHLRTLGVDFARLQGSTPAEERGRLIDRFNKDPECRVFLASLKAGGTGIDLVGGSVVIHYDRWWNAAREDQATDRVHRLGQKRAVQVFKLVTEGTLEERIAAMIEEKRDLLDAVVQEDDPTLRKLFDRSQLLELLQDI